MASREVITASASGETVYVAGSGFTPSSGGQQVFLWIGSSSDQQDGEYAYPPVAEDGTFRERYARHGASGVVRAFEYQPRRDRWVKVAESAY